MALRRFSLLIILIKMSISCVVLGQDSAPVESSIWYRADVDVNAGSGTFAPYYIASNQHGTITQAKGIQLRVQAHKPLDMSRRFSWGAGVDVMADAANATGYMLYSETSGAWEVNGQRPSAFRLQQLYGELKWRSLFMTIGLKQHGSALLNNRLASGDLVESGNARPIPEIRVGFLDFRDIPLTGGWLQLQGEVAYGKPTDSEWLRSHFNHYNHFVTTGWLYHYKRLYFRTRPECNLSVTFGMQAAGQFSGTQYYYIKGQVDWIKHDPFRLRDIVDMFLTRADDSYYKGNHVGSWDMKARYRLPKGDNVYAYFQWPWEDGSGIGKLNGFDGTWGLEWHKSTPGLISGLVAEVLYFMNQSGPIHCDPDDLPGSDIPVHTDGSDDYYNNYFYNGYAYYGMGIGSPVFPSPIYNTDGYMRYADTRLRGFHIGLSGEVFLPGHEFSYRLLCGYREAFGSGYVPRKEPVHDTSWLIDVNWRMKRLPALSVNVQLGVDRGTMYGNQAGFKLGVAYTGSLSGIKQN